MKLTTLLFLRREDEILLAMKKRGHGIGKWNGVGGKVEPNESVLEATIRECVEEIGVTPEKLQLAGELHFFDLPDIEFYCYVYIARTWQGEPHETEEMRPQWFMETDIPYDSMWSDDTLWMPLLLAEKPFKGSATIDEANNVVRHDITEVKSLEEHS